MIVIYIHEIFVCFLFSCFFYLNIPFLSRKLMLKKTKVEPPWSSCMRNRLMYIRINFIDWSYIVSECRTCPRLI